MSFWLTVRDSEESGSALDRTTDQLLAMCTNDSGRSLQTSGGNSEFWNSNPSISNGKTYTVHAGPCHTFRVAVSLG